MPRGARKWMSGEFPAPKIRATVQSASADTTTRVRPRNLPSVPAIGTSQLVQTLEELLAEVRDIKAAELTERRPVLEEKIGKLRGSLVFVRAQWGLDSKSTAEFSKYQTDDLERHYNLGSYEDREELKRAVENARARRKKNNKFARPPAPPAPWDI